MTSLLGTPWLIEPSEFERVISQAECFNSDGEYPDRSDGWKPYSTVGATAVIPVTGVLTSSVGFKALMLGWTPYPIIADAIMAAASDPAIETIRFEFDTPGGSAAGVERLGDVIYGCKKRTEGVVIGQCSSAGYWLGSQCDSLVAFSTAIVGSIGTIVRVASDEAAKEEGLTTFRSSPLKHADPTGEPGASHYQQLVDDLTDLFVKAVARGRSVSEQEVRDNYGDGASMVASRALDAGMIDGIVGTMHAGANGDIMPSGYENKGAMMADIEFTVEQYEALQAENASLVEKAASLETQVADLTGAVESMRETVSAVEARLADAEAKVEAADGAKAKAEEDLAVGTLLARGTITKAEEAEAREAYGLRDSHPTFWARLSQRSTPAVPLGEVGHGIEPPKPEPKLEGMGAENFHAIDVKVRAHCEAHGMDYDIPNDYIKALEAVKEALQ